MLADRKYKGIVDGKTCALRLHHVEIVPLGMWSGMPH